ncbi:hypothetical protein MFLAVUS_004571 [Mucor flavus]|uniref:F-box domain-containing protein n=1 Tax=Mucor flavus TaxID=439312 RepID=A0ABP9YWD6_9FUNG
MVKFLQYTLTIPKFKLEFALKKHNVMNIWTNLMRTTGFDSPEFINFQHKNLKFVTKTIQGSEMPFDYLNRLSLNLPNLEQLSLIDKKTLQLHNARKIRMNMPNTKLNMLSWSGKSSSDIVHDRIRCYIKTNTAAGERFYTGSKKVMFKITKQYYTQSSGKLYFDITCNKLDTFQLTIGDSSRAEKEKTTKKGNKKTKKNHFFNKMATLPFEILNKIFKHLPDTDLSQCELVNKNFYEASVERLYSNITLTWYRPNCFIRTVLRATSLDPDVWVRLMYAAKEGQLAHLKELSVTRVAEIDNYIDILLFFKNSVTTLLLCDADDTLTTSQWSTQTTYQLVVDRIKEFPPLQHLSIGHHTNLQFYNFDTLIEKCQSLKSFSVRLYPITCQVQKENIPHGFISKRPDINKLVCNRETVKCDDQLNYIMHKLPNLQYLNILYDPYLDKSFNRETQPISSNTVREFFKYILAIPTVELGLQLEKSNLINIYIDFMKINPRFKRLTISYMTNYRDSSKIIMKFEDNALTLGFEINSDDPTLSHFEFLSRLGHLIQSLTIESIWETLGMLSKQSNMYDVLNCQNWIKNVLEAC